MEYEADFAGSSSRQNFVPPNPVVEYFAQCAAALCNEDQKIAAACPAEEGRTSAALGFVKIDNVIIASVAI